MTGSAAEGHQPETFRPRLAPLMALAWYALAVFSAYDLVRRGDGRAVPVGLAGIALVTVVVYAIAQRPVVVADARGVLLRNVLRDVWLPWHAVKSIRTQWSLSLETADRSYSSWALTGGGAARQRRRRTPVPGSPLAPPSSLAHEISWTVPDRLEQLRRRGLHGERSGEVEVSTAWRVLGAFGLALVALLVAVVVPTS